MSPRQFEEFKKLSAEDWRKVWKEYHEWTARMQSFGASTWMIVLLLSAVAYWYWHHFWLLLPSAIALYILARRSGQREGYGSGFEAGFDQGCNRGLGVSEEEALKIHEEASEAAAWDCVDVAKLRAKTKAPGN